MAKWQCECICGEGSRKLESFSIDLSFLYALGGCGGLSENVPHGLKCLNTCFQLVVLLGKFRRCGLAGESTSLGVGFEVFLVPPISVLG